MYCVSCVLSRIFFFQAEDGIRDAQESRGLGDVYKRQSYERAEYKNESKRLLALGLPIMLSGVLTTGTNYPVSYTHLTLPTIYSV